MSGFVLPTVKLTPHLEVPRRRFLQAGAVGLVAASSGWRPSMAEAIEAQVQQAPETLVKELFLSLSDAQRTAICFDWDHRDPSLGLLRTRVANNWNITKPMILSDFYTPSQQGLVRAIFEGIIDPSWHARFDQQFSDDMGGWGEGQSVAIFGMPGSERFEFVLTGRHTTLRCDGNTQAHVAMGGPIFYGHAAGTDEEAADHPGNVFWPQAVAANSIYQLLDRQQRQQAEVAQTPSEEAVGFRAAGRPGLALRDLNAQQRSALEGVLTTLLEPFRGSDRAEVRACLEKQGGWDQIHLAYFTDDDIGGDRVWDNWRLEGPSFVWHFRGSPHVHVWVNIADDARVELNA